MLFYNRWQVHRIANMKATRIAPETLLASFGIGIVILSSSLTLLLISLFGNIPIFRDKFSLVILSPGHVTMKTR